MHCVYSQFKLEGNPLSCARYGSGHINQTYLLVTDQPHLYILQRLSQTVFKEPDKLMSNLIRVTDHLRRQGLDERHVLTLVETVDSKPYLVDEEGAYWRLYEFVTRSLCLDKPETPDDFYQSAKAFGQFQNQLSDFDAGSLYETIPHFHDTPERYNQLKRAIEENRSGRLDSAKAEIEHYLSFESGAGELMNLYREGKLPLRVTHNDTKLNNVMLDSVTRTPLCVIDLDTVMPGFAANDFGDSIRFGANTAAEDEKDVSKVSLSLPLYNIYAKGFLETCGDRLTDVERMSLPTGARLMTLECGVRFLADYLNGDTYFRTAYPEHNLVRCRTQIALVEDMDRKWNEMLKAVQ